ncbi:hypothetical protein [Arthrobacter sp. JSM 101049]|uniref:hypothetical protein n=1 Tax=Arthrobacter sp. JSM 101049 TaxID=929097 RepID=UPI0035681DC0
MADCERGLGKPEKALETAHSEEAASLDTPGRVEMAIVASGAQSDLGNREAALAELQIPQLDINRAFSFSPRLFEAYAMALEALGKNGEAELWRRQISLAERALGVGEFSDPDIMDLGEDDDDDETPGSKPRARDLVNDAGTNPASDTTSAPATQVDDEAAAPATAEEDDAEEDDAAEADAASTAHDSAADESAADESAAVPQAGETDEDEPRGDHGSADPADSDK